MPHVDIHIVNIFAAHNSRDLFINVFCLGRCSSTDDDDDDDADDVHIAFKMMSTLTRMLTMINTMNMI